MIFDNTLLPVSNPSTSDVTLSSSPVDTNSRFVIQATATVTVTLHETLPLLNWLFCPCVSLSSCGGHKCHSPTWWWAATWMVAPTKLARRALSSRLGGALPLLLLLPLPLLATKHLLMLLNPRGSLPDPRWRAAASLKAFRWWGQDV